MSSASNATKITIRQAFAIALIYQVLLVAVFLLSFWLFGKGDLQGLEAIFSNWDAKHYLGLAQHWYVTTGDAANRVVYLPLLPLLIRLLSLSLPPIFAGLLITWVGSIVGHAAFILLLDDLGYSRARVWRTFAFFVSAPAFVFFAVIYTEGLFLAESAVFLLMLRKKQFLGAAVIGSFAAMTRLVGVLFIIPFIFECIDWLALKIYWRRLLLGLIIVLGLASYLWINWKIYGDAFHFSLVQRRNWQKGVGNPLMLYWQNLSAALAVNFWTGQRLFVVLDRFLPLTVPPLMLVSLLTRKRSNPELPISYHWWTLAQLLIIMSQTFWLSSTRYLMLILPLSLMLEQVFGTRKVLWYPMCFFFFSLGIFALIRCSMGWWTF